MTASRSLAAPRILLVEDDPIVAYALEQELAELGGEVLVASDGHAALRLLTDEILALDLVVTDLEMPALDGLELVRLLRTAGGETELAIVAIADDTSDDMVASFRALGVGLLHKEVGLAAIGQEARRILEYSGKLEALSAAPLDDAPWAPQPRVRDAKALGRITP